MPLPPFSAKGSWVVLDPREVTAMLWYNIASNDQQHSLRITVASPTLSRHQHCIVPAAVLCSKG